MFVKENRGRQKVTNKVNYFICLNMKLTSGGSIVDACFSSSNFCFFSGGGESDS